MAIRMRGIRLEATVDALAESIGRLGLRAPISVRHVEMVDIPGVGEVWILGVPVLVTGRHRLLACMKLGMEDIDCVYLDGDETDAKPWELSENLHRSDLTAIERAENVAEWVRLTDEEHGDEKPGQLAQVSKGGRGKEGGLSAAVRDLGIERTEVRRAVKIAGIEPEAKLAAEQAGISTQKDWLDIARAGDTVEAQVANVTEVVEREAKPKPPKAAPPPVEVATANTLSAVLEAPTVLETATVEEMFELPAVNDNWKRARLVEWETLFRKLTEAEPKRRSSVVTRNVSDLVILR